MKNIFQMFRAKQKMNKKGFVKGNSIKSWMVGVIAILVFASFTPIALPLVIRGVNDTYNAMVAGGLPFSSFLQSGGIIYLLLAIGVIYWLINRFSGSVGGKGGY